MPTMFVAPTQNYIQKTLNGAISDSVTTITLNNTNNMQAPGYIVIDREDSAGTATPNSREVVSYTGISGSDLTGCTRGADGSTARAHNDTALVETMPTIGMWNNLTTIVSSGFTSDGYLRPIASPVSLAIVQIKTHINASGASVTGIGTGGLNAVFQVPGSLASQANIGGLILVPTQLDGRFISAAVLTPASVASIGVHILKNGAVYGVCEIPAAATFASSASIGSVGLVAGDRLTLDIRSTASMAGELSVLLRAT